jgi:hypothetical protein
VLAGHLLLLIRTATLIARLQRLMMIRHSWNECCCCLADQKCCCHCHCQFVGLTVLQGPEGVCVAWCCCWSCCLAGLPLMLLGCYCWLLHCASCVLQAVVCLQASCCLVAVCRLSCCHSTALLHTNAKTHKDLCTAAFSSTVSIAHDAQAC